MTSINQMSPALFQSTNAENAVNTRRVDIASVTCTDCDLYASIDKNGICEMCRNRVREVKRTWWERVGGGDKK